MPENIPKTADRDVVRIMPKKIIEIKRSVSPRLLKFL
jgi:hypothetical protein